MRRVDVFPGPDDRRDFLLLFMAAAVNRLKCDRSVGTLFRSGP